jgi:hypothetical protein
LSLTISGLKQKGENTRYAQQIILQHWITFIGRFYHLNLIFRVAKFKCGGWTSLKKILCYTANLSWLSLPLGYAPLARNHDHANKNLIIKIIMILWFTTHVLISFWMNLFIYSCYLFYTSMVRFGVLIEHDYWIKTCLHRIWLYI